MELLHRYSGLEQRLVTSGLKVWMRVWVSRDREAIREKIETELKIRKWFQDRTPGLFVADLLQ